MTSHLIRPILYPKQDVPHKGLGASHRTLEELAVINNPQHPEAHQPESEEKTDE